MWPPVLQSLPQEPPPTPPLIKERAAAKQKKDKETERGKRKHELEKLTWEKDKRQMLRKIQNLERSLALQKQEKMEERYDRKNQPDPPLPAGLIQNPRPVNAVDYENLERIPRTKPLVAIPEQPDGFPDLKNVSPTPPKRRAQLGEYKPPWEVNLGTAGDGLGKNASAFEVHGSALEVRSSGKKSRSTSNSPYKTNLRPASGSTNMTSSRETQELTSPAPGRAEFTLQIGYEDNFKFREEMKVMNDLRMKSYSASLWGAFHDWKFTMQNPKYKVKK
mmetsp:Transcript_4972/g.12457  ORF Transcript_4972/g.12457 Transcript_4972/m.12457 type:complete len:276 (+) Transcript_4972:251-1078(+)|eukprot:CAMPEP_0178990068 /NCGR_PEP_ID=MMETSP0795-20121207/4722_1 /TAXON_ID=88552 /ORGANISM="Amoebophrya sp., Strain Ameob2" /LENGTH=275 /DNA_ID=CAMNT_0020681535 /DNA_START=55 /DNA_END=882 /DNA_ORIENTATION=-